MPPEPSGTGARPTPSPKRRRSSLRTRLLAVTLPLVVAAVIVSAWVANQQTRREIRNALETERRKPTLILNTLQATASEQGGWQDIDYQVKLLAAQTGLRIAIYQTGEGDGADSLLADSDRRQPFPDGDAYPIVAPPPADYAAAVRDIEDAAYGNFRNCLDSAGISWSPDPQGDPGGVVKPVLDSQQPSGHAADLKLCTDARNADLAPKKDVPESRPAFPSVNVYLGPTRIDSGTLLSGGVSTRLMLTVAGVAGLTLLATALVARRMTRPIEALTLAVRRMADGNLDERVPEGRRDELGELSRAFNSMAASLAEADRQRRRSTTDIAHELRTPLSNIRGYLEAAQDGVAALTPQLIDSIHEDALLLQALVDDLQELSLAESGQLHLDRSPTDLDELVTSVADAHRARASAATIDLTVLAASGGDADVADRPATGGPGTGGPATGRNGSAVRADVDARRIRQVLTNLVENAIRHTPPSGRITMAVRRRGDLVEIAVVDTGSGIPSDALPHVFDRFYRADRSRHRATGGSGLGLAITRELITAHGGTIDVASTPGQGSTFTVRLAALPAAPGGAGPDNGIGRSPDVTDHPAPNGSDPHASGSRAGGDGNGNGNGKPSGDGSGQPDSDGNGRGAGTGSAHLIDVTYSDTA